MKDFFRGRKASIWIVAGVILISVVLLIRIKPKINWSAVGAVAAWFSAIASVCAIVVAVQIPKRIADNQNKIALFDKRFEFYDTLLKCISFCHMISNSSTSAVAVNRSFINAFIDSTSKNNYDNTLQIVERVYNTLQKGKFLFDIDMKNEILDLSLALVDLTSENEEEIADAWLKYREAAQVIEQRILPMVAAIIKPDF